jgi:glycosyltransferase involved in cell wall biosynthesis
MSRSRSVWLVSRFFPPESAVGALRVAGLCRHLVRRGWDATVITARPPASVERDEDTLQMVPQRANVIRTACPDLPVMAARIWKGRNATEGEPHRAASATGAAEPPRGRGRLTRRAVDWLSWWLHVPDSCTGWLIPAAWAAAVRCPTRPPAVVFCSGPVWTAHLAGAIASLLADAPLVADFRDPWSGSPFQQIPYAAQRHFSRSLEALVIRRAVRITCAWDGIRRHLARRYPHRAPHMRTVLNGFDPDSIDGVEPTEIDAGRCVFLHAGSFYGPRSPVPVLAALRLLRDRRQEVYHSVLVVFVGPPTYGGEHLESLAREHDVADAVRVVPPVPHRRAIAFTKGADVAMLYGQSGRAELASVPAKAYEFVGASKPVLAVGAGPEACEIMRRGGCSVWEAPADDVAAIAECLADIVVRRRSGQLSASCDPRLRRRLTQEQMAEQIEAVLEEAIAAGKQRRRSRPSSPRDRRERAAAPGTGGNED